MAETHSTEAVQREILELSNQLLRSAGESESTAAVLAKIIELCHQAFASDQAFILLHDRAADELVGIIQTGAGYRPEGHFRLRLDEPSLGVWAFKQEQSTAVEDAAHDARVSPQMRERFGVASSLAAPLRLNQIVNGVLMITSRTARTYSARDVAVLEALAREAAYAMHAQQSREARMRAETALGESEFRFQALLEAAPEPILVHVDGRYVYANPAALELHGATSLDQIVGKDTLDLVHPDSWDLVRERVAKHLRGESVPSKVEQRWVRLDGTPVDVEVTAVPFLLEGKPAVHVMARDITARKQAEAVLRESNERNRTLLEVTPDGIWIHSNARIAYANGALATMLGYDNPQALIGREIYEFFIPEFRQSLRERVAHVVTTLGRAPLTETAMLRRDGSRVEVETAATAFRQGDAVWNVSVIRNITDRKRAEQTLRESEERFRDLAELSSDWFWEQDATLRFTAMSDDLYAKAHFRPSSTLGKLRWELPIIGVSEQQWRAHREVLERHEPFEHFVYRLVNDEGEIRWFSISGKPLFGADGAFRGYRGTGQDITARKIAEDEIERLAFYDPLTQLPNRRLLLDRLQHALASSARSGRNGALLFIDLDNFKTLNDTLGHDKGDLLLQQVAQRLATCVREGDTVARLGGDEFVVMLEGLSENPGEAATQTEVVGEKIITTLNQPYLLAGYEHRSTPSIGVTLFGGREDAIDELLKQADLAMYQSKAAGRNTLRFFDPKMQAMVTDRAALEADLREAVAQGQFVLYYQPQVVRHDRLAGAEVLVRWQHPRRGIVSPAEFIPLAEETGLILPLGNWVLETACAQLATWAARPHTAQLSLAVNISANQLQQADFVAQVLAVLASTGADPQRLKLELTESLLLTNVENSIAKMTALKAKGVGFSLDDFGTGYSSLSHLKRLPLDQLKIDQSFVRDILVDSNDAAIAKMVVALAESMGLTVVAEGVETEAQRDYLARQGCHSYQGFLLGRPMALHEFEAFVTRF
ncbi:MAG: EAL domain-containing protein [Burkholderiales bacterium]